jgi:hypothetical protein
LQDAAASGIARRFAHQRRREHPGALDARDIAVARDAPHVADPALRVAASQSDDPREEARERARARQSVIVDTEAKVAVDARRVGRQDPAIDVAHRLGVFRRAEGMPVLLALAGPVAERRREPEFRSAGRARTVHRGAEQRVDPSELEAR